MKKPNKRIAELESELFKFKACDILRLKLAGDKIKGAGNARFMGSGVVIEVKTLSGESITGAFVLFDGLSESTIAALSADIEKTFMNRIDINTPKGLRESVARIYSNKGKESGS